MKYGTFLLLILSVVLINQQPAMSQACTDPGGCSAVSYAAFQHTVGVVQFGNTTGRVVSKKKATLCPEANCNSFFTQTTALVAPRTTAGVSKAAPAASVTVISVRRALTTAQTGIFRNTLDLVSTAFRLVPQRTKFSSFPFSMGFGNNAIAFLNLVGTRNRIVSQVFNPTANTLSKTTTQVPPFANQLASAISRDGKQLSWANRVDAQTVNFNFRPLNPVNRKPAGPPEVNPLNMPITSTSIQTISSIALSDSLRPVQASGQPEGPRMVLQKQNVRTVTSSGAVQKTDFIEDMILRILFGRSEEELAWEELECPNTVGLCEIFPLKAAGLGPPKPIVKVRTGLGSSDFFQSVAIDPQGRFVIYTVFSPSCKKWILKFQRINPVTGKKIGGAKLLAGCPDVSSSPANSGVIGVNVINLE